MSGSGELDPIRGDAGTAGFDGIDWPRLLRAETPADALAELAQALGAGAAELILESTDPTTGRIADWRRRDSSGGPLSRRESPVRGRPPWRLLVAVAPDGPDAAAIGLATQALEGWREAQHELGRAESRLAQRTRELDLIQGLARRAADSRSPDELFERAITVLQEGEDLDVAMVAHAIDDEPETLVFFGRPVGDACLAQLSRRAGALLGWSRDAMPRSRRLELDSFDEDRGVRSDVREEELVLLPVPRRDGVAACLAIVPARRPEEGHLRLFYNAANQICLHLDRILTVREAEAGRFRATLDSMPQAVLLADGELRVIQANRSAKEMFEGLALPLCGSLETALERLDAAGLAARVREAGEKVADGEVTLEDGRILGVTVAPVPGGRGRGAGLVLVLADVTESRRLQRRLAHSEKMSSLGQMISGVAHELNNPLTSILGYAQLLGAAGVDEKLQKRLDVLQREAERCRDIVQNLLSFARRREPERRTLSLNEVVKSVVALMGYQLRVDGVEVRTELFVDLPPVRGDAHQLQQLLVNLLTNARQAIQQQEQGGSIVLRTAESASGEVTLEVRDDGPGVPEAIREKIFDPFFTTKPEGQGTGLGLSLVYGILRDHGGAIEALPCPDGAVFLVRLPAAGGDRAAETTAAATAPGPARPGRILVVEDEAPLARMICEILVEEGHRVEAVPDAESALERLDERIDLIISDIKMPGMSGEKLFEEIRRKIPALSGRLLLTTGDTVGDDAERIARRTGLDVLPKPFDADGLRRAVREQLHARRAGK